MLATVLGPIPGLVFGVMAGVALSALSARAATTAQAATTGKVGTCATADVRSEASRRARAAEASLLMVKVAEMETDVPAAAQAGVLQLKEDLVQAIDAEVACHEGSDAELQRRLATVLQANLPQAASPSAMAGSSAETATAGAYGGGLMLAVTRPRGAPGMLAIDVSFEVACGDDYVLLLYARREERWERRLRWQSPRSTEISGAFGGFFLFDVLMTPEQMPEVVVAHGTNWCTSRFSSGVIDVLRFEADGGAPRLVWHTQRALSRGDYVPRLKVAGSQFEVRWNAPALDPDGYERTVVYRYRVRGDEVSRVSPIAVNGRGFIEEWLSAPWAEAETQTAVESRVRMKSFHADYERAERCADTFVGMRYGPVTACAGPKEFQVEMESEARGAGEHPEFYRIRETGNGYELLDEGGTRGGGCKRRD